MSRSQLLVVWILVVMITVLGGIAGRWWWVRSRMQSPAAVPSASPQADSLAQPLSSAEPFHLQPPRDSLIGKIEAAVPIVSKLPRDGEDWVEVVVPDTIVDGDRLLATGSASVKVDFPEQTNINLVQDADVSFSSTLPESFLVRQSKGTVTYSISPAYSISVRALHALFALSAGEVTLQLDPETAIMNLAVANGRVTIGMIDADNETQTWTVQTGQTAVINDKKRTVVIE